MKENTYVVEVYCTNCEWEGTQTIKKGISVYSLQSIECPVCGCENLCSRGIPKGV